MKKIILLLLLTTSAFSQEKINVQVYADAKLLLFGDGVRYDAGTLDLLLRSQWQGNENNGMYLFVFPQFEFANLKEHNLKRYSVGAGVGYNVKKFTISPMANYGILQRFGKGFQTWEFGTDLSVKVAENISISNYVSLTQRKDLLYRWGDNAWRFNYYIGLTFNLK